MTAPKRSAAPAHRPGEVAPAETGTSPLIGRLPSFAWSVLLVVAVALAIGAWIMRHGGSSGPPEERGAPDPRTAAAPAVPAVESGSAGSDQAQIERAPVVLASEPTPGAVDEAGAGSDTPSLTVRTFSAEGDLLAGCRIVLRAPPPAPGQLRYEHELTEIRDGMHEARALPLGHFDVLCRMPNLREPLAVVTWDGTESRDLSVSVASREDLVGGIVTDHRGTPVADVVVEDASRSTQAYFCVTDAQGRFRFARKAGGTAPTTAVRLSSGLGSPVADTDATEHLQWGNLDHRLAAKPRGELTIRLLGPAGEAVGAFAVRVHASSPYGQVTRRAEAVDGVARVPDVPTGAVEVLAMPGPEWLPVAATGDVASDGAGAMTLHTQPAVVLEGVVRSATRLADLVGARAALEPISAQPGGEPAALALRIGPASTSASRTAVERAVHEGRFAFGCDPDRAYRLRVTAPGFSPYEAEVRAVGAAFDPVTVELRRSHVVRARIRPVEAVRWLQDYAEQQVAGAQEKVGCFALIQPRHATGRKALQIVARADGEGLVEFSDVSAGEWSLWLWGPRGNDRLATLQVVANRDLHVAELDLAHLRPGRVDGVFVCEERQHQPSLLTASCGGGRLVVGVRADGRFTFLAPEGEYAVRITLDPGGDALELTHMDPVAVRPGQTTSLTVHGTLQRLRVVLVANATGQPVAQARLSVDEERATGQYRSWTSDEAGVVDLHPCPLGEFGLSVLDERRNVWAPVARVAPGGAATVVVRVP